MSVQSAAAVTGRRVQRVRGGLLILGAWTFYGLIHAAYWLVTIEIGSLAGEWPWIVSTALGLAWVWAALTPGLFRLATAAAPSRIGWVGSLLAHGSVLAAISLGMTALRLAAIILFTQGAESISAGFDLFWPRAIFWFDVHLFTYLTILLTGRAIASHRRYVDRALRAHVLETQLARAQLHFLELQLQPHFLFNSLNAIQELAHESPDAAERMLRRLHSLLSLSLERSGRDEVSLAGELEGLEPYLDIQRARFEWLTVRVDIEDEARTAMVPHLILQPLVENAIRHGLAVRQAPGHIDIAARRRGDRLVLRVEDDGVGLAPLGTANARAGIGLRNAGERLRQLYGADHRFELRGRDGGGVLVEIEIPLRQESAAPAPTAWPERSAPRSREAMPEIPVDDIAAWRTGEFAVAMDAPTRATSDLPDVEEHARPRVATPPSPVDAGALAAAAPATPEASPGRRPLLTWRTGTALAGVWLGAAVLWTLQLHAITWLEGAGPISWNADLTRINVAGALYWMAVSSGVLFLARRFRLVGRRFVPHLALHIAAAVAASFTFFWVLELARVNPAPIRFTLSINPLTGNFFVYFALIAWSHSRDFVAWYRARELTAAQLTSEISRSRFHSLCVQVRPQFLLGTLDLLARLVHLDVPRAERLITRLGDVLRLTLDMAREHTSTLQQELDLLVASVEAHRLGIRPSVTLETSVDSTALATPMPSRLLCTMVDDLLADDADGAAVPLTVQVTAERGADATRIRLHADSATMQRRKDLHAWWRKKSAAEAAVMDAGPLVSVAFPDRATAVVIVADEFPAARATPAAA